MGFRRRQDDRSEKAVLKITSDNKVILNTTSILSSNSAKEHVEDVRRLPLPSSGTRPAPSC